jgi:hypothetical protein
MKIIKKLTTATVHGKPDIKAIVAHDNATPGATLWLWSVIGIASDYKPGSTDMGSFVKFVGAFEGSNLQTGEVFRSGACILPGALPDMIFGALKGMAGNGNVQFGFKIGVHFDDTAAAKYVFDIESLADVAENDPVKLLKASIEATGKLPSLPAPQAQPALAAPASEPAASTVTGDANEGNLAGTVADAGAKTKSKKAA